MASLHTEESKTSRSDKKTYKIRWRDTQQRQQILYIGKASKKSANEYLRHVSELIDATEAGRRPEPETELWLRSNNLNSRIRGKLTEFGLAEPENEKLGTEAGKYLGAFCQSYVDSRTDCKAGTLRNFEQARRLLEEHFGTQKLLRSITQADAEKFRRWLVGRGMAESTVGKHVKRCKTIFGEAVKDRLLEESPFQHLKGSSLAKKDFFYVTPEIISDVLDKCPNDDWRLIFGLARYCGMRCPSEVLTLQWSDILWAENKIRIDSPKTGLRFCALFPEIRPILERAFEAAPAGERFCVIRYRYDRETGKGYNPGTTGKKIIESAGDIPWEQPFIALRKTRRNELELAGFRSTAIDAWLGHDDETAKKHYSRVTDTDFERGSQLLTIGQKGNAGGNSYEAIRGHIAPNEKKEQLKPRENDTVASSVPSEMTPTGLEPVLPP